MKKATRSFGVMVMAEEMAERGLLLTMSRVMIPTVVLCFGKKMLCDFCNRLMRQGICSEAAVRVIVGVQQKQRSIL